MKHAACDHDHPAMDGEVALTVIVGEGHLGSIAVRVGGALVKEADNVLRDFPLGRAEELRGKTIRITSVVSPVNTASPRTALSTTLSSGAGGFDRVCAGPEHGGELVRFKVDYAPRPGAGR